jgi:hypothetical protein
VEPRAPVTGRACLPRANRSRETSGKEGPAVTPAPVQGGCLSKVVGNRPGAVAPRRVRLALAAAAARFVTISGDPREVAEVFLSGLRIGRVRLLCCRKAAEPYVSAVHAD